MFSLETQVCLSVVSFILSPTFSYFSAKPCTIMRDQEEGSRGSSGRAGVDLNEDLQEVKICTYNNFTCLDLWME